MNAQQWTSCPDPFAMLDYLARRDRSAWRRWLPKLLRPSACWSSRKRLLFACACCRRVEALLPDGRCRAAVTVAERHADGLASKQDLVTATLQALAAAADAASPGRTSRDWLAAAQARAADAVAHALSNPDATSQTLVWTREAVRAWAKAVNSREIGIDALELPVRRACVGEGAACLPEDDLCDAEGRAQADLLRDIVGQPIERDGKTVSAVAAAPRAMADSIYRERAFARLVELADALAQTGWRRADVIEHFREGRGHVAGCWALDIVLRKR